MKTERYSRQIVLKGFGTQAQQKLADSRILVIGAGGLGCPALQYLVGTGVGCVGIADGDTVSLSNLHRQPLYNTSDIGRPKAEVAWEKLIALNPEIKIDQHPFFITADNCLSAIDGYDLILDCTDNFETRYLVNDACILADKPLIFAAVSGYEGQVAVFTTDDNSGQRTNYRDLFPVQPGQDEVPNCEENGVIGVLPGIIGTMQAAEAIKLVTGVGTPLINKLLNYNMLTQEFYEVAISPAPEGTYLLPDNSEEFLKTNYNGNDAAIAEIDIEQLHELVKEPSTLVIDVRESFERPVLKIDHLRMPMSVFSKEIEKPISSDNIVLICQHGIRSLAAAKVLKEKYREDKTIYSLKGGVARWGDFL